LTKRTKGGKKVDTQRSQRYEYQAEVGNGRLGEIEDKTRGEESAKKKQNILQESKPGTWGC